MAYGVSNGHVTDDVTWPPKVLLGGTVGCPSDSLASCYTVRTRCCVSELLLNRVGVNTRQTTCVASAVKFGQNMIVEL